MIQDQPNLLNTSEPSDVEPSISPDSSDPIDLATLSARCMGNSEFALALLEELENSGSQLLETMTRSMAAGDGQSIASAAHSLKGAAAIIGAETLRRQAAQVEVYGRQGRLAELSVLLQVLQSEMTVCLEFVGRLRGRSLGPIHNGAPCTQFDNVEG